MVHNGIARRCHDLALKREGLSTTASRCPTRAAGWRTLTTLSSWREGQGPPRPTVDRRLEHEVGGSGERAVAPTLAGPVGSGSATGGRTQRRRDEASGDGPGSGALAPHLVDDEPVWSVVCFFVERRFRRMGLTPILIEGACDFAARHRATVVEGYPVDKDSAVPTFAFTGLASAFRQTDFARETVPPPARSRAGGSEAPRGPSTGRAEREALSLSGPRPANVAS